MAMWSAAMSKIVSQAATTQHGYGVRIYSSLITVAVPSVPRAVSVCFAIISVAESRNSTKELSQKYLWDRVKLWRKWALWVLVFPPLVHHKCFFRATQFISKKKWSLKNMKLRKDRNLQKIRIKELSLHNKTGIRNWTFSTFFFLMR